MMNHYKSSKIIMIFVLVLLLAGTIQAAELQVSQPTKVTNSNYYERGQAPLYDGTDYWLFYGRSASVTGNYQDDNPDVYDYQIYYKKAATVEGLASATPVAISGAVNCYLGEIGAAYVDGNVWAFAAVPSTNYTGRRSLYGWYSNDGGSSWTLVADLADNLPDGAAHHDEVGFDGKLYIMSNYPDGNTGWYTKYTDDPTAATITWSSYIPLNSTTNLVNGTGHFFVDGTDLYIGILRTNPSKDNKVLQYVASPESWSELCTAVSTGWDPTLFKVGSDYVFAQAPWASDGGGWQHIIAWHSSSPSTVLSGSSFEISEGRYGTNTWTEMWPIGFTDAGGNSYLFFTSERDVPSQEGTGNIWYLKVDWDLDNNHYSYIGEAVGAVTSKALTDTVFVTNGTYFESNITISNSMTVLGESRTGTIIAPSGEDDNLAESFGGTYNHGFIIDADDVVIKSLTLDGEGNPSLTAGKNNFRIGMVTQNGVYHSNITIDDVTITHMYWRGLYLALNGSGGNLLNSTVNDVEYDAYNAYGLLFLGISDGSMTGVCQVANNQFTGIGGRAIGVAYGSYDVDNNTVDGALTALYNFNYGAAFVDHTVTMTGNDVSNVETGMNLVGLTETTVIGGPNPSDKNILDVTGAKSNRGSAVYGLSRIDEGIGVIGEPNIGLNVNKDSYDPDIGILFWWTDCAAVIQNNEVICSDNDAGAWIFHCESADPHPIFDGNVFTATASDGTNKGDGTGIFMTDDGDFLGDEPGWTYATLVNNTVTGFARGIDMYRNASSPVEGRNVDAFIEGNSVTGNGLGLLTNGGGILSCENNRFAGNTSDGLKIETGLVDASVSAVYENDFSGNGGLGLNKLTTGDLDASGNYWGSTDPATVAGMVTANIDYTPWLGGGTDDNPGFSGDYSELWVDDNSPQTGTVNRIQEGVDLVDGSTVNIAAGNYDATIDIDTRAGINLVGADKTTTIIKSSTTLPWNVASYGTSRQAVLRVVNSTDIAVSGVTFDYDLIKGNNIMGFLFWNSTGSFDDNIFENMSAPDASGYYYEIVGYVRATTYTDAARAPLSITNNTFAETGRVGLVTHDYCDMTITGNTFYKTTDDFGYAMEIGSQSIGTVSNNTIYGYDTPAASDGSNSAGIYVENSFTGGSPSLTKNVTLSGNEIYDCQWGFYIGNEFNGYAGDVDLVLTATGNNIHDNLDGGVVLTDEDKEYGSSVNATFQNNTVMSNGEYGYLIFTNGDGDITALLNNELIIDQDTGIFINDYTAGSSVYDISIYGNALNNGLNAECNVNGVSWDDGISEGNCWADFASNAGYPSQYNIPGTPGGTDSYPSLDCTVDMTPDDILYHCTGSFTFDVEIGDAVLGLDAANITISYPAELSLVSVVEASSNLQIFYNLTDNATGSDILELNLGVLSGVLDGPATLFTIELSGSTDYCSGDLIQNTYVQLLTHDPENNIITIPATPSSPVTLVADCEDPVLTVNTADGGYYNVPPVINFGATDNCDIDAVYYQLDGCTSGGWNAIVSGFSGTAYGPSDWTLPTSDWNALSEDQHCIRFKVTDDNELGNADSCSYTWCFTKDITAPPAPADLTAKPGHNKVKLTWSNASSDFDHTVIIRNDYVDGGGHGYPEYDDVYTEAAYPADTTDGDYIYVGTDILYTDTYNIDNANRDVYHYAAFTVDAAGNVSAPASAAQARSTSYWLGDFFTPYDGYVYFTDLSVFSNAYGTSDGDFYYNDECDIGPTFTNNTRGVPETDNEIGFEDLTIFAINFDDVSPTLKSRPIFAGSPASTETGIRAIGRQDGSTYYVDIFLENANQNAKAAMAEFSFDSKQFSYHSTTFSEDLTQTDRPVFMKPLESSDRIAVSAAVLGQDQVFEGSGLIATIQFEKLGTGEAEIVLTDADIRDCQNQKLLGEGFLNQSVVASAQVPDKYELLQNYPNPFNPETEIAYLLPEETWVSIKVYNISGQLVKTLVDEVVPAGKHTVRWNGTGESGNTVATGVYFYRMETEKFQRTAKMILVK